MKETIPAPHQALTWKQLLRSAQGKERRRKRQPSPVFSPGDSQGRGAWGAAVYGAYGAGHAWATWQQREGKRTAGATGAQLTGGRGGLKGENAIRDERAVTSGAARGPHPQTPALRAFPSLPRCRGSLAASKPLALQPQGAGRGSVRRGYISRSRRPPWMNQGMPVFISPTFLARFPGVSVIETPPAGAGDAGGAWWTWAGKIPGEEMAALSNIPALQSPADRGAWRATVRGVAESPRTERGSARVHAHTHLTHAHVPHTRSLCLCS